MTEVPLRQRPAWRALEAHHDRLQSVHLRELFAEDEHRGERLTAEAVGVLLDYSKNRVTDETLRLLVRLAGESGLRERIDAMFRGDRINVDRGSRRAARGAARAARCGDRRGRPGRGARGPRRARRRWPGSATGCAAGEWKGHTGKPMRNVVNIGIGGSDLGPVMAYEALAALQRARA